jgi:hypothetical protein
MDSASPIAQRTAGRISVDTGTDVTFAMWTNKAGNIGTRRFALDRFGTTRRPSRGYRDVYRRSYGEGRLP